MKGEKLCFNIIFKMNQSHDSDIFQMHPLLRERLRRVFFLGGGLSAGRLLLLASSCVGSSLCGVRRAGPPRMHSGSHTGTPGRLLCQQTREGNLRLVPILEARNSLDSKAAAHPVYLYLVPRFSSRIIWTRNIFLGDTF